MASAGSKANIRAALDVEPSHPAVRTNPEPNEDTFRGGSKNDIFDFHLDSLMQDPLTPLSCSTSAQHLTILNLSVPS